MFGHYLCLHFRQVFAFFICDMFRLTALGDGSQRWDISSAGLVTFLDWGPAGNAEELRANVAGQR